MTDMILVYITCKDLAQAKQIGKHLLNKKLCACVNIIPQMYAMVLWPAKSDVVEEGEEVILIAKTVERAYSQLEAEVHKIHTYQLPCIFSIPVSGVDEAYYQWLVGELQ